PGRELEVDAVDRLDAAEGLRQAGDLEERARAHLSPRSSAQRHVPSRGRAPRGGPSALIVLPEATLCVASPRRGRAPRGGPSALIDCPPRRGANRRTAARNPRCPAETAARGSA